MIGWLICRTTHRGYYFDRVSGGRVFVHCRVCGRGFSAALPGNRKDGSSQ